ncbi:hypothetical protein ACQSMD_31725 [Streptomyces flavovirens]|uniref:hypothetical protein n=1 Tax=Streptomyces flavovirens TaxID=52258 RepID=UPI003D10F986
MKIEWDAGGPVRAKDVGVELGIEAEVKGGLEPLHGKLSKLAGRGRLRELPDGRFQIAPWGRGPCPYGHAPGGRWLDVYMKGINELAVDTGCPVYQCRLWVSRRTNEYCTDLLSRRLKKIGSRSRAHPHHLELSR